MFSHIRVERTSEDKLTLEVWDFSLLRDVQLVLTEYTRTTRKSLRHKFLKPSVKYSPYSSNTSSDYLIEKIAEKDVPWPEGVRTEALHKFIEQIKIGLWSDFSDL